MARAALLPVWPLPRPSANTLHPVWPLPRPSANTLLPVWPLPRPSANTLLPVWPLPRPSANTLLPVWPLPRPSANTLLPVWPLMPYAKATLHLLIHVLAFPLYLPPSPSLTPPLCFHLSDSFLPTEIPLSVSSLIQSALKLYSTLR
ncbi:unnamed protein product [Gadus morhua 'NCC']